MTELFAYLIQEPVSKRRDAWIVEIAGRLRTLEDRLGKPLAEELKQDEGFTTLLLGATQVAMRNHKAEKIAALANAVMNTAIGIAPEETERSIMLDLVDRMTAQHLAILQLLRSKRINDFVATMYEAFPALQGREDLVRIIWRDLGDKSLMNDGAFTLTDFGKRFLAFIGEPKMPPAT